MFTLDTETGFRDVVLINAAYGLTPSNHIDVFTTTAHAQVDKQVKAQVNSILELSIAYESMTMLTHDYKAATTAISVFQCPSDVADGRVVYRVAPRVAAGGSPAPIQWARWSCHRIRPGPPTNVHSGATCGSGSRCSAP